MKGMKNSKEKPAVIFSHSVKHFRPNWRLCSLCFAGRRNTEYVQRFDCGYKK